MAALTDAGFPQLFTPPGWGGAGGTFSTLVTAVAAVGEGCTSAAWVAAVFANFGRLAGFLPHAGQRRIWGHRADVRLVGAVAPTGRALPAPGGWILSGSWQYVSGASFSHWALLAAQVTGDGTGHTRFFAVPRHQYELTGTWSAPGMRGTGSDTVGTNEVFVPEELSFPQLTAGTGTASEHPWLAAPSRAVTPLCFVAPALGAATAALSAWADRVRKAETAGRTATDATRIALARSLGEVDAARLLMDRAAAVADSGCAGRFDVVRNARDAALATDLISASVGRLYRLIGTSGQAEPRFQRPWRDITTAAGHALLGFEAAGRSYTDELIKPPRAPHGVRRDARSHCE
ncbi:hydrolase [Streptomyces sp. NBC_00726]|uniref:hydrolase n=1 Tax=Streptomyces sp. NBC_00726 TaxID=2903674 RepID=UPI00386E98E9